MHLVYGGVTGLGIGTVKLQLTQLATQKLIQLSTYTVYNAPNSMSAL
jgi:hypothetical protein